MSGSGTGPRNNLGGAPSPISSLPQLTGAGLQRPTAGDAPSLRNPYDLQNLALHSRNSFNNMPMGGSPGYSNSMYGNQFGNRYGPPSFSPYAGGMGGFGGMGGSNSYGLQNRYGSSPSIADTLGRVNPVNARANPAKGGPPPPGMARGGRASGRGNI